MVHICSTTTPVTWYHTNKDIDFYFCQANDHEDYVSHEDVWDIAKGEVSVVDTPPTVKSAGVLILTGMDVYTRENSKTISNDDFAALFSVRDPSVCIKLQFVSLTK